MYDNENENPIINSSDSADNKSSEDITDNAKITDDTDTIYIDAPDSEEITEDNPDTLEEITNPDANKDAYIIDDNKSIIQNILIKYNSIEKKKLRKIVFTSLAVIILFLLIITDIIPILPNSYHRSYVGKSYELTDTQKSTFAPYDDYILYASDGRVLCFEPNMNVVFNIDSFSGKPSLRINDDGAIVYVTNSYNYLVFSDPDTYKSLAINEKIISANVSSKGDYVIVTQESGYEACLNAFTKDNNCIYKWHTNDTITDSAISDNAKYVVASSVVLTEDNIYSKLTFLGTSSDKVLKEIELTDNVISELVFVDDSLIIAFGSEYTTCYTINGIEKWKINYNDKVVSTYDISDDGYIAFIFNRYNSEQSQSTVNLFDVQSGELIGEYKSEDNIKSVSLNNDYCLLTTENKSILLDDDCDLEKIKKYNFKLDSIELFENYHFGFVIDDNKAQIVSVKR